jgi:DNA-binding MarR family transcriptional regulator
MRAAAARIGMPVTDMQVLDILDSAGSTTAGRLADLTGLTTGAVTGMLNRLEAAGLVRRERDPDDGRRVIVQLERGKDDMRKIGPIFASIGKGWDELAARYTDEQVAFLLDFLKRSNALSRSEIARLREAPEEERGAYSAPLGNLESGRLAVSSGIARLTLRASSDMAELFQARFEGPAPKVKTNDGVVTIHYPRRLWGLGRTHSAAEITLNGSIPWQIAMHGGASEVTAELGDLDLAGLEVSGGLNLTQIELPAPSGVVPIRVSGGASEITMRRPAGVAARVHLKGWASVFAFDDQTFTAVGNDVRLQSPGFDAAPSGYDIEVIGSASTVTITSR